jgi:plastocyanin
VIVVYAEQVGEHEPPKPGHYELKQHSKTFLPHILAVPVGSAVTFPNDDPIFHNVFSLTRPGPFDLGLYRAGDSKTRVFNKPAIYRVFCNIHPQMSALLLVLPTSFIAETDAGGSYRMDLPPGRYRLSAWSEHSEPITEEVSVETAPLSAPELTLDESKFVEMPHKNKYGLDYPASAYEPGKP